MRWAENLSNNTAGADVMPSLDVHLAWATPVKIETLGAHLEAYVNLLPIINTLRVCNRYGKGPKAAVTRLPPELVDAIEQYLITTERLRLLEEWTSLPKCWYEECEPHEHFTEQELLEAWQTVVFDAVPVLTKADYKLVDKRLFDEYLQTGLDQEEWYDLRDEADDEHQDRQGQWFDKVGSPERAWRGYLGDQAALFREHFGLDIWTSHVQREKNLRRGKTQHSTVSY